MQIQSSITWIDFSESDRRRMIEVISLFKQRDTRDELGLGSIRDKLANLFFPGTSTLETRARYFLFIPWLYHGYEQRRVPSARAASRLRSDELKLIGALKAAGEAGVIGQVSGASLHRFPSSIYWNGLRDWGILRYQSSQSQYHNWLDSYYRQQGELSALAGEYEDSGSDWHQGNWDPNLPVAPDTFPGQVDFVLSQTEAFYLRERLLLSRPESLLTAIVDRFDPTDDVPVIWSHPQIDRFTQKQRSWIDHARNLSECMLGAALLYNLMLAEQRGADDLIEGYRGGLAEWRATLALRIEEISGWDQFDFWRLVNSDGRIPSLTVRFVKEWIDLLLAGSGFPDLVASDPARQLVREREWRLKRGRSRFESLRHLEMWSGAAGAYQLDFRWRIARRITNDILQGLGRDVES